MYEMWKRKQIHEDCTGPKFLTKSFCQKFWKMEKASFERSPDMVQNVLGICKTKNGTETDELLQNRSRWAPKNVAKC